MIVLPSNSAPGKGRGRTPVAITIDSAVTFSSPTWTVFGATTLATPNFDWTLYFRNSPSIPLFSLAGDAPAPRDHLARSPSVASPLIAERLAVVLDQLDEVGVGQQGLGRDAAPVQADAAELVALDAEDSLAELRGADRPRVARRTAADHHDVVVVGHVDLSRNSDSSAISQTDRAGLARRLPRSLRRDCRLTARMTCIRGASTPALRAGP